MRAIRPCRCICPCGGSKSTAKAWLRRFKRRWAGVLKVISTCLANGAGNSSRFIRTEGAAQTNYLYKDWPAKDLPRPEDELDFAAVKRLLNAQLASLMETNRGLAQNLEDQSKNAGLDRPLGRILRLTNDHLESFSIWTGTHASPTPALFIRYLGDLKTNGARERPWMITWPLLPEDETRETQLAAQFQQIYDLCTNRFPEAERKLMVGDANYFSATWQKLNELENTRQEKERVQGEIDRFQERVKLVPGTLEEAAYVGLFIVDPRQPRRGLEMIRFDGP